MRLQARKYASWPLCLLLLAVSISGGHAGVLCIGDNGRTAFETACLPWCGEGEAQCSVGPLDDRHDQHGDCANCTDLSLNEFSRSQRPVDGSVFISAPASVIDVAPTASSEDTHCQLVRRAAQHDPPVQLSLMSLATTVLLI